MLATIDVFMQYAVAYIFIILHSLLQLSIASLHYHARKYAVSADAMREFLQQLRFPLSIYRINEVSRLWDEDSSDTTFTPLDIGTIYLMTIPFIALLVFGIFAFTYGVVAAYGGDNFWINVFWLVTTLLSVILLRPWRFGRSLEAIQQQADGLRNVND